MSISSDRAQLESMDTELAHTSRMHRAVIPVHTDGASELAGSPLCDIDAEPDGGILWVRLRPEAPVSFTPELLADLRSLQDRIARHVVDGFRYQVFASGIPGVFSLGGDLALFRDCIGRGDAQTLRAYARDAADLVYTNATGYEARLTTISLVQGQALGGGFEAALAAHVVVAERGARMGLPEIMFNMFPGMGAYQLLCRRLSPAEAERMILGGRTYRAEELHALGVVDVLAEDGDGERAVRRYIRSHDRQHRGMQAFRRAQQAAAPLDRHELYRVTDVWVESALDLGARDMETIDYLLRAQQRLAARAALLRASPGVLADA